MAQPITMEMPPRDAKRELMARLEAAPAEHAAALLDGYELLQALHDHGMLTLLRGTLGAGTKLVTTAAETANTPEAIRAMRNAILLGKMLGSIDPELLASITAAVSETLGDVKTLPVKPPGLFAMMGQLFSREMRYALSMVSVLTGRFFSELKRRGGGQIP